MSEDAAQADAAAGEPPPPLPGLMAALLDALRTRLELAGVELEIHLIGLARTLLWAVATILCALLALAFCVVALIAALWDSHRVLGLIGGGLAFLLLAIVCGLIGARLFRRAPGILASSVAELDRDRRRAQHP
ncbi:MAG TPA: phage holin family protein [Steroidobacteraceae bacterium]|nr:phage holin family protein [Gammaproteobacteria bacterium]HEV2284769.1 phage holin family protein [Steroidobacteraceae bacterium]